MSESGSGRARGVRAPAPPLPFDPVAEARRQWEAHGWGEVADGMAAVTSLMRAQQIVLARVDEVLRPMGLTFARYELLALLGFSRHGSLPMAVAARRLQVHPTSVTNAVDRLAEAGLVQRSPHPSDRRTTLVELTEVGQAVASAATDALNSRVFADVGMPPGDVATLVDVLTGLRSGSGDFDASASASAERIAG